MSIERYRNDNPRSAAEVATAIETELRNVQPSAATATGTQNFALISAVADTIAQQQEQSLHDVYDAAYITDATGDELEKVAREVGVTRNAAVRATGVVEFSRSSNATQDYLIPSGTVVSTGGEDSVDFETTEQTTISSGTTSASANVRAINAGPSGNVGASTIQSFASRPTGVEEVTNPNPTGDPTYTLTNGTTPLITGRDAESDKELRERALDATAIGGAGSAEALELALENIDNVVSADVYSNRSSSTNNNVDPWHTEVRVYQGDVDDIAERLYEVLPLITLRTLQGGANGTLDQTTFTGSDLYGDITIPITRPTEVTLEITVDFVHDSAYGGDDAVKDAIVKYIGGTLTDGSTTTGLGQSENVIVNEVENVVEDVAGVVAVTSSLIDENSDGNDDTTTDSDGVQVLTISGSEVPVINAADITLNKTAR